MNVTLIGMPGAGKSTIGKEISNKLDYAFFDIDVLIERDTGKKLQEILNELGDDKFLKLEEKTVLGLGNFYNTIIAPGGSIVYSSDAMLFLKGKSHVIYLHAPYELIEKNIHNLDMRGIVGLSKGLKALYAERIPLYKKHADAIFDVDDNTTKDIIEYLQCIICPTP